MPWECQECEATNDNGESGGEGVCASCGLDWHIWQCPICEQDNADNIEQETMCNNCGIVVYIDFDGVVNESDYHIFLGKGKVRTMSHSEWSSNQRNDDEKP